MGSLVAALASFLDAKTAGGSWSLRIDDIDPPREAPDAKIQILESLRTHGLHPDGVPIFQSKHAPAYETAIDTLRQSGLLFTCTCTRATLGPGGCCVRQCWLQPEKSSTAAVSLRIQIPADTVIEFNDLVMGPQRTALDAVQPNFIVKRRDGLYAYQLAAAVDDAAPTISHVIRGADLLESTPRQMFLRQMLGLPDPEFGHTPVLRHPDGSKLSKQTGAPALNNSKALDNIRAALNALGQPAPSSTCKSVGDAKAWALDHWDRDRIPTQ